jgi:hypothetical protein
MEKDINERLESVKILELNIGENLKDSDHGNGFLYITTNILFVKAKINKWGYGKLCFLQNKGNNQQNKQ